MKRWLWLLLALVGLAFVLLGVHAGQHGEVRRWADTLCTSCIGLTEGH